MSVKESMSTLKSDLGLVLQDISMITHELSVVAQNGTAEAKDRLELRLQALNEKAAILKDKIKYGVSETAHKVDDVVHDHPYKSIAIAAGVGLLAGYLLSKNK